MTAWTRGAGVKLWEAGRWGVCFGGRADRLTDGEMGLWPVRAPPVRPSWLTRKSPDYHLATVRRQADPGSVWYLASRRQLKII